jgi:assimilatory nitrate reductase catalytic subunit
MRNLDFLAVSDICLSETAALADVVPPTTQWAEESGTTTNLDDRVILRQAAVTPPGEVRSDVDVMTDLAKRAGAQGFSADAQEVFAVLGRANQGGKADYGGISCERIAAVKGVFWPRLSAPIPIGTGPTFQDAAVHSLRGRHSPRGRFTEGSLTHD